VSAPSGVAFALPDKRAARRGFEAAAGTFDDACFVHDETRARLLARLDFVRLAPRTVVDLGCATGRSARALAERYRDACVVAVDSSAAMLRAARGPGAPFAAVAADAERLPLRDGAVQLVCANLTLPWCDPRALFLEAARVLEPGGLLLFATLGPDSLQEVRRAWSGIDTQIHVHAAFDMHDLGDLAVAAGLAEPVMDVDRLEVTYAELGDLVRDLRACGAMNVAAGRRRGLTGAGRWRAFERRLNEQRRDGRFAVTMELVFGQAWGRGPARKRSGPPGEVAVGIERIGRRS
jgi:malonyl-CoA O-methyltransferase